MKKKQERKNNQFQENKKKALSERRWHILLLQSKKTLLIAPSEADKWIFREISEILSDPGCFAKEWLKDTKTGEARDKVNSLQVIEKKLIEAVKESMQLVVGTADFEIKKIYKNEMRKTEEELVELRNNLKQAKQELSFAENKLDRLSEFHNSIEQATKRIVFSTKGKFKTFLDNLPFQEKKRIIEAVVSPELGGKYFVRHPTLADIADNPDDIPKSEFYTPLPERGHILVGTFSIDLNRIQSIISDLNYACLLNSAGRR